MKSRLFNALLDLLFEILLWLVGEKDETPDVSASAHIAPPQPGGPCA